MGYPFLYGCLLRDMVVVIKMGADFTVHVMYPGFPYTTVSLSELTLEQSNVANVTSIQHRWFTLAIIGDCCLLSPPRGNKGIKGLLNLQQFNLQWIPGY